MSPEEAATAEGDLLRTPFPHLLVYMADRRLNGELLLRDPCGLEHVVRFEWGAPVHARADDGYMMFGELLVEAGIVSQNVVDEALATKSLLGDVLILTGHADGEALERIASTQLERRLIRLFSLPPATTYRYYEGPSGGVRCPGSRVDLLRVLASGLRAHPRSSMPLARLMEQLEDMRLGLHLDAALERFAFTDDEASVTSLLDERPTFVDLLAAGAADPALVCRVVYLLLLTRQLDTGHRLPPLGADDTPQRAVGVGRVQLRAHVHRLGAAAPDPVGDGERAAVQPRTLRRRRDPAHAAGGDPERSDIIEPASDIREILSDARVSEPVSDVIELAVELPPLPLAQSGGRGNQR